VKEGARVDSRNKEGLTPLSSAIKYRRYRRVEKLLSYGADVNAANKDKTTPVLIAADHLLAGTLPETREEEKRITDVLELLLRAGADVHKAKVTPPIVALICLIIIHSPPLSDWMTIEW
jgi:ankyrin repeat protein